MTKTLDTTIELARYYDTNGNKRAITIREYNWYVENKNKNLTADFIFQRLQSRYLKPFQFIDGYFGAMVPVISAKPCH